MDNIKKIILITLLYSLATPVIAEDSDASVLVWMFAWWNEAVKDPDGLTKAGLQQYYTEDARLSSMAGKSCAASNPWSNIFVRYDQPAAADAVAMFTDNH